eukprot:2066324-Amphidinium_carterae.1
MMMMMMTTMMMMMLMMMMLMMMCLGMQREFHLVGYDLMAILTWPCEEWARRSNWFAVLGVT